MGAIQIELAAARSALADVDPTDEAALADANTRIVELEEQASNQIKANAEALGRLAVAKLADNPVAAAVEAVRQAEASLARVDPGDVQGQASAEENLLNTQRQLRQAQRAARQAANDLAAAQVEGDPIAVLRIQIRDAQDALATAGPDAAARDQAKAQLIRLRRQLNDAIVDAATAEKEMAIALAQAAGDPVAVALLQLELALSEMDRLRKSGAGDAELRRAKAQVIAANAAVRDARYQTQLGDIDFALQMEQITTQQAIAQLEALLRIPALTKEQTQQLLLKIKQLRDELGRDAQFNIPSFLDLPTLYEARRYEQTGGGRDYHDTRYETSGGPASVQPSQTTFNQDVAVTVIVPDTNATPEQIATVAARQVSAALSAPPVNSVTPRLI